ncbi:MAG: amidase [Acidiferrobacterales bacterium]
MTAPDLAFASIGELAPRLAAREISPVELTEAVLARIAQLDDKLNAYITVLEDRTLQSARTAESDIRAGDYRSPLHGVPVAIKDLFATRGVRTTFGSPLFSDWVPDHDAAVVEHLGRAGAVIVGKTNLHELAYGTTSANPHYGPVHNPWNLEYHPGGSSGGSAAAVAAGLTVAALGSDTGASIRQPAACCGVVGLKPTFGLVSKFGALPLAWSLDHVGPITRTVRDCALSLQVLAGFDGRDPASVQRPVSDFSGELDQGVQGARIGVVREFFFENCEPEVVAAVEASAQVFHQLGARVEEVTLPDMRAARDAGALILAVEAATYHAFALHEHPEKFSDELKASLELGEFYTGVQYVQAQRVRRELTVQTQQALKEFDAVIMPTSPTPATLIADDPPGHITLRGRNTMPFDLISLPAISIPCGFTGAGLPVGLQIVGKAFDEARVLQVAYAYEQATDWHRRYPQL